MSKTKKNITALSALSIGIGGMIGGGIFAILGLAAQITQGATPIAFILAGLVALVTSYAYVKLSLTYPSEGGTVEFLNCAFGQGVFMGGLNILLSFSYIVLLSLYAFTFGTYATQLFIPTGSEVWLHIFISGIIILLAFINYAGPRLVVKSENLFNVIKLMLLLTFVVVGFAAPISWERLAPENWVPPFQILAGGMIIFLNYEGFELIANVAKDVENPKRTLPIAYYGGVLIVMVFYILISIVAVGHLPFDALASQSDFALAASAEAFMGKAGFVMIVIAALVATSSAINATLLGSGRITYSIAKSGELPSELQRKIHGQPLEGMIIFSGLTLIIANFVPLNTIAAAGSTGFLVIFLVVNIANVRVAKQTGSRWYISALGALLTLIALIALSSEVISSGSPAQLLVIFGMIALAFVIEFVYRAVSGRTIKPSRYLGPNEVIVK